MKKLLSVLIMAVRIFRSDQYCLFTTKNKQYNFDADMDLETFKYISSKCIDYTMMEHNLEQIEKIINKTVKQD